MALPLPTRERTETESTILHASLVAINRMPDVRAMRNNSGALEDVRGRLVRYGLGEGSPDIVGIITLSHVACAFGLEVKRPGSRTKATHLRRQEAWRAVADRKGMLCREVRSAAEAVSAVQDFRAEYMSRLTR